MGGLGGRGVVLAYTYHPGLNTRAPVGFYFFSLH